MISNFFFLLPFESLTFRPLNLLEYLIHSTANFITTNDLGCRFLVALILLNGIVFTQKCSLFNTDRILFHEILKIEQWHGVSNFILDPLVLRCEALNFNFNVLLLVGKTVFLTFNLEKVAAFGSHCLI